MQYKVHRTTYEIPMLKKWNPNVMQPFYFLVHTKHEEETITLYTEMRQFCKANYLFFNDLEELK